MPSPPTPTLEHPLRDVRAWFFCGLLPLGFGYVAMHLCGRATPFESGDNRWNDWLGILLSGPALYLLGARHTLVEFAKPIYRGMIWNVLGFGVPFFAALHWEYLGQSTGANFSLTAHQLAHLNRPSQIALFVGLVIAAGMTTLCILQARKAGFLGRYLGAFAALIGSLAAVTACLGPRYYLHIHHYFWSLCLVPFVRFRHPLCVVVQGMLVGIYVEGASRYGLSPIWILHGG